MGKFDRRNCITVKVQEKVKGQTLLLVKVKGYFFILTEDADQSTVTINVSGFLA